jgi:serine/threonine-protein kinase
MLPLFYCAQLAFGGARLPGEVLVKWWGPVYICAGLSFAAALSIRRTAKALAAAREEVRDVGRYELVEKLSEGGMGQVWRARHRFLPHDVAVKMIRPAAEAGGSSSAAADLVRRFHLEAQAVAMLTSPNTVHLFDYGVSESGELFAVMEYLNGLDLKRLVEEHGVLPPGRVVHLLGQICLSLAEAHEKGLVHRDLKPANLMVCRLGCQSDFVKVLDFGLVGAMSHFPESLTGDEKTSTVSGTPGFIAPEVLRSGAASERSDLYSLGVVAYWLLTGTTLFPRDDGGEEIGRHLTDVPEDPGKRRGAPVPADLTAIVLRLLEKDPARRPASALELRREVRAVGAAGTWTEEEAKRWWDEHHDR